VNLIVSQIKNKYYSSRFSLSSINKFYLGAKFIELSKNFFFHHAQSKIFKVKFYATLRIFSYFYFHSFEILILAFPNLFWLFSSSNQNLLPDTKSRIHDLIVFTPKKLIWNADVVTNPRQTRENNSYIFGIGSGSEAEPESGLLMRERERKGERERRDKDGLGCACSLARAKRCYKPFRTLHIAARCHRGNTFSWVLSGKILCRTNSCWLPFLLDLHFVAF